MSADSVSKFMPFPSLLSSAGSSYDCAPLPSDFVPIDPPLFRFDLVGCADCAVFLGGDFGSTFSCVFCAELCVGLIILSRKPPEGAAVLAVLVLGLGLGLSIGLERAGSETLADLVGLLSEAVRPFVAVFTLLCRLGDRGADAPSPSCLAVDAAVGAVADTESLIGLLGDFGRVLLASGGDAGVVFFVDFAAVAFKAVCFEAADLAAATGAFATVLNPFAAFCILVFGCVDGSLGAVEVGEEVVFGEAISAGSRFWDKMVDDGVRGACGNLVEFLLAEYSPDVAFADCSRLGGTFFV